MLTKYLAVASMAFTCAGIALTFVGIEILRCEAIGNFGVALTILAVPLFALAAAIEIAEN